MTGTPGTLSVGAHRVGPDERPLVIAELGINHDGDLDRMHRMIDDAADAGVECVKFQSHVVEDEMTPNDVVPGNADESIYGMMQRCALSATQEREVFAHAHERGMLALSTPFSRAAADRLAELDVPAFKIGSGECNNYPLVRHIASFGKPVLLSTGMNDVSTIRPSVELLRASGVPFALTHCTSMYPTPPEKVRLGAVAVGAAVLERHFASDLSWSGPDIPISSTPEDFARLIEGADVLGLARGGRKEILPEEQPTIDFAHACVVTTRPVHAGDEFTVDNL